MTTVLLAALNAGQTIGWLAQDQITSPSNGTVKFTANNGTTGSILSTGPLTINGALNLVDFGGAGIAAPTLTTPSAGTKLRLYDSISGSALDFAIGVAASTMWFTKNVNGAVYKFYEGTDATTLAMTLGGGAMVVPGTASFGGAFGCNSATAQTAYASGGALAAYGAGANGFDTSGHASALYAMVVAIRAALVANGIMS